jgi:glycosyltransferase involved in cell wall biosynthesis
MSSNLKIRWRLFSDESEPTSRQRGINVYTELQRQGVDAAQWDGQERADVIVLQYNPRLLDEALAAAKTVVMDINDMTFADCYGNHDEMRRAISRVHAIVAGSPRLEQYLVQMHPTVRMIEEAVDPKYFKVKRKKHEGTLQVFWMGMHDNMTFFEQIDGVLDALAQEFDFLVNFVCPEQDGSGRSNAEKAAAKPYNAAHHKWTFETVLQQMALGDLGVAPLFQNAWSWGKCANKALSMMAAGLPVAVEDVPSYRAAIEGGVEGYLCFGEGQWEAALRSLFGEAGVRKEMGKAGKEKAGQYAIEGIARQWAEYLREVSG